MADSEFAIEHAAIWTAIEDLATQVGLSLSALAVRCGMDASALSPSKRKDRKGRPHWPSMGTVTLILAVTDTSYGEFGLLVDEIERVMRGSMADAETERAA